MLPLTRLLLAYGADPDARDKRGVPVHASTRAPDVGPCSMSIAVRRAPEQIESSP